MSRLVGKDASFHVSGVEIIGVYKWSMDDEAPELDLSGFDSGIRGTFGNGRPSTKIDFSGHWDTAEAKLYGAPPVLVAGAAGLVMKCYVDAVKFFQITVNINTMHYEADESGNVDWNGSARVTGAITFPV
jgi:hypothetical protein